MPPDRARRRRAGVAARTPPGYGLVGMAERAALLGGTLEAGPERRTAAGGRGRRCPRSGRDDDPGARRRRPGDRPHRAEDDPRRPARHRGRRRGRRRARGGRARPRAAARRLPVRHPHAGASTASRPRGSSPARTSPTRWPSSSSPRSTSTSTSTARSRPAPAASCSRTPGPSCSSRRSTSAANGDALIAPSVTARLLAAFADAPAPTPPAQPIEPLTAREEEVLRHASRAGRPTPRSPTSCTSASAR